MGSHLLTQGQPSISEGRFSSPRVHGCLAADPAFLMEAEILRMELAVRRPHVSGRKPSNVGRLIWASGLDQAAVACMGICK